MRLFKNNVELWHKDADEILFEFASSKIFFEKDRCEQTKLALFISFNEPAGLQSTFLGYEFTKLWDYWTLYKYKFLAGPSSLDSAPHSGRQDDTLHIVAGRKTL